MTGAESSGVDCTVSLPLAGLLAATISIFDSGFTPILLVNNVLVGCLATNVAVPDCPGWS